MHGTTALQRKRLTAVLAMAGTLAAGIAGGFAARYAHLPLPWLLGSLFTIMALSLAGVPVRVIRWGRPAGTIVVGASTGLQFTASVMMKLVTLLPMMIGAAFVSTLIGAVGGLIYMRLTGVDRSTAFFATVPGGVVETTTLAPHYGAQLEPIMVAQTTRVALIVMFAPFLVISFAGSGGQNPLLAIPVAPWLPVLALLAVSGVVGALLSRTRSPSAFLLPPLFLAAICGALGWIEGRMPDILLIAAQIVIGSALGAQFRPEFLTGSCARPAWCCCFPAARWRCSRPPPRGSLVIRRRP
jgi:membrane AbrB-like protein